MSQGLFIVIEGAPGAGAASQLNLLGERLKAIGHDVQVMDMPRLGDSSGHFIRSYLKGDYGSPADISPYTATLFYALDRYEAAVSIKRQLAAGKIVLSGNYVGANMAEQGSKFTNQGEQRGFFVWNDNLEYELLGIPRPDINFYLRLPAEVSASLTPASDKQEPEELKKRLATYDLLCRLFPKDYKALECSHNGQKMALPTINNQIWDAIKPLLPPKPTRPSRSVVVTLGKEQDGFPAVSNGDKNLSLPIKESSVFLKLLLEQIRPGSTSPGLNSWPAMDYRLYKMGSKNNSMPKSVAAFKELRESYQRLERQIMQKTDDKRQAEEILLALTPLAAVTSYTLSLKKDDIQDVASRLLAREQAEAQWAAKQIYIAARQKWPADFKRPIEADQPSGKSQTVMAKLASEWLSADGGLEDRVKLLDASPRREFDLLAESIYPYSNLSLAEISEEVMEWPYTQKSESLRKWVAQPGLLKKVCYRFDIISDMVTQIMIAQAAGLRNVAVQPPTPRFGYDIPESAEGMRLEDVYSSVFDASLAAFSYLQAEAGEESAVYAVLLGHKVRWQLQADAEQMRNIQKLKKSALLNPVISEINEKLSDSHPLLWDILNGRPASQPRQSGRSRVKPNHRRGRPKKT